MPSTTPKLQVIIPGFGAPYIEEKLMILERNLTILSHYPFEWKLLICIYETQEDVYQSVKKCVSKFIASSNVSLIQQPGIVGQFIKKYANPYDLENDSIDYMFILLDDVELMTSSWSWDKLLYDYNYHGCNICSPTMTHDSKYLFPFMLTKHHWNEKHIDVLLMTSACEFFCYFMNLESYKTYYQEIDENHPWMWGIDLVLTKHLHFKVGMLNYLQMKHYFQNTSTYSERTLDVFEKMNTYLSKYEETQQSLASQPAILEERLIYHRSFQLI
jgi:hypothetical protein